jgi:hypothetical protein
MELSVLRQPGSDDTHEGKIITEKAGCYLAYVEVGDGL